MTIDLRLIANGGLAVETGDDNSDTTGLLTATASTQTFTALTKNVSAYRSIDEGAGYFTTNFGWTGEFNISAGTGTNPLFACGVNDQLLVFTLTTTGTDSGIYFYVNYNSSTVRYAVVTRNAGTATSTTVDPGFSLSTTYYYRLSYLSSLSRYGSVLLQIYSNPGLTTQVSSTIQNLAAALPNSFRFFYPVSSINSGIADTLTGTNANITLATSSAGVDLTTYTTSGAALAAYADCEIVTALASNVTQYTQKDDGVGHWSGNFNVTGVVNLGSNSAASANCVACVGGVTNTSATHGANAAQHSVEVIMQGVSTTTSTLKILEQNGSSGAVSSSSITITAGTPLWHKLRRDTAVGTYGTYYCQFYSDPARNVPFGSEISLAAREAVDYRYSIPVRSYNNASANTVTFTFGGVNFNGSTQTVAVGQTSETDLAQHITVSQGVLTLAVNQVAETDIAQAITATQGTTIAIGQVAESDLAQPIAMYAATTIAVGQATEIDFAQIILLAGAPQTVSVGQVTETDAAQALVAPTPITIAVGQVSEIEVALAITVSSPFTGTLGQVSETDTAFALTVVFGVTETWSINLKHPTTGLALTGLGNTVVKFEAYQESTGDWFNSVTNTLQTAQPTPLALLEDISGNHNGRYAAAATIGVFDEWMVLHIYWDYDASDGRGTVRRHKWARVRYNSGVEWLGGLTVAENSTLTNMMTTLMTEDYPVDGQSGMSPAQALYAINQMLSEFARTGTSVQIKKRDGSPAFTLTLNSATAPTSSTQSS